MTNKHLPEIPFAREMEAEGIRVKELNLKLLQKIEKLILFAYGDIKTASEVGSAKANHRATTESDSQATK